MTQSHTHKEDEAMQVVTDAEVEAAINAVNSDGSRVNMRFALESFAASRPVAGGVTAPEPERWIVVNEVAVQTGIPRPELAYAVFEGSVMFPSFEAASEAITELGLPLGWVAMEVRRLISPASTTKAGGAS